MWVYKKELNMSKSRTINSLSKFISIALFVSLLFISFGCATQHSRSFRSPLPKEIRQHIRSVAVIPTSYAPKNNFLTFAKSRGTGTAKGAAEGALYGMLEGAQTAGHLYDIVLWPFATVAGAVVYGIAGGIEGTFKAVPEDEVQKIEAMIAKAIANLNVQEKLAEHVMSSGWLLTGYQFSLIKGIGPATYDEKPEYRFLSKEGIDLALEVSVKSLGFSGGEKTDPSISFFMNIAVKAFRPSDVAELYSFESSHTSRPRKASEWGRKNAALLQREFETAYASLANQIVENIFLLYNFHVESIWSAHQHCMLKPYYPPPSGIGVFTKGKLKFSEINSLRPAFRWEEFPREKDKKHDSTDILGKVTEITYDLRIWEGRDGYPEKLVYDRLGLLAPEHTVEITLKPSTEYFWTVRARFILDGDNRITKWSYSRIPRMPQDPCSLDYIPLNNYYRFRTP